MNARRFGVSTICAMFSRVTSKTSGSSCSSRNALDLVGEGALLGRELEVHAPDPAPSDRRDLTARQSSDAHRARRSPSPSGDDAALAQPGERRRRRGRARRAAPRRCARRPTGTRVSGPSATFDSFTGLPGTSTGSATPSVRGISTSMLRAATCGSAMTSDAWLLGPATMPAAVSSRAASSFVRCDAHASTAGRITVSRCGGPAGTRSRSADRRFHSGLPDEVGEPRELVLAHDLHDDVAVGRAEALADHLERLARGSGRTPSDQKLVTMSVIATHRVEHRDVDVLALAGARRGGAARRGCRSRRTAPS